MTTSSLGDHRRHELVDFREESRVAVLNKLDINALRADATFDSIAQTAARICHAPMAHVSVLDNKHQHIVASKGLDLDVIPLRESFCKTTIEQHQILIIEDATKDGRFRDSPYVTDPPHIRFYVGLPVLLGKRIPVGTLCVLDRKPHRLSVSERASLFGLLRQVEAQLEQHLKSGELEKVLRKQVDIADEDREKIQHQKQALATHLLHNLVNAVSCIKSDANFARTDPAISAATADALTDISRCVDSVASTLSTARHILLDEFGRVDMREEVRVSRLLDKLEARIKTKDELLTLTNEVDNDRVLGNEHLLLDLLSSLIQLARQIAERDIPVNISIAGLSETTDSNRYSDTVQDDVGRAETLDDRPTGLDERTDVDSGTVPGAPRALQFCKMIVEAHRGEFTRESYGAMGEIFSIALPTAESLSR